MGMSLRGAAGLVALVVAGQVAVVGAQPALAFDLGCRGECYERVHHPDTYASVERPVVVRPGYREVQHQPAVVMDRVARVEAVPGRWHEHHTGPVYGSMTRTVQVSAARTVREHLPAVTHRVRQEVVVRPAHVGWEHQRDLFGRETLCKVVVPAETRTVERDVVVAGPRTVERVIPAQYRTVQQPVLVQPARTYHTYQPPVYDYVSQPMVVRPAMNVVVEHPPVVATERQEVLVRRGGDSWEPSRRLF